MDPVVATMVFAYITISITPTAASSEVSLYSKMNSLVSVGITLRNVCGMIIETMVWAALIPSERAASD